MSRPITVTESFGFKPAGYSDNTFPAQYYSYIEGGFNDTDNSTYHASFAMRSTSYSIFYDFGDLAVIPSDATITSVSCSVRGNIQISYAYPSVQLYSGTTAKGSATNITTTSTISNITNLTCGTWTRAELQNARLKIQVAAYNSNATTSTYHFEFYGASLVVNYSYSGTDYEITFSNSIQSTITSDPNTQTYVPEGYSQEILFAVNPNVGSLDNIIITDNGVGIKNQLTYFEPGTASTSLHPASFLESGGGDNLSYPERGCQYYDASTNYASIRVTGGNTYLLYKFDELIIPSHATINSVTCTIKGYVTSSSFTSDELVQLYAGSTLLTTAQLPDSSTPMTLPTNNITWVPGMFSDLRLKLSAYYNSSTSTAQINFYGATLTVSYTIPGEIGGYLYTIYDMDEDHLITINQGYELTVNETTKLVSSVEPSGTTGVLSGSTQNIFMYLENGVNSLDDIIITDNGVDVKSQFVYTTPTQGPKTYYPAAFVDGRYQGITNQTTPVGKGSNGSNTTYAQINLTRGVNETTEAIWSFDCSSIPIGATITNVTCSAKCLISNPSRVPTRQIQLYSGTTAKGSATTISSTSATVLNLTPGTWTREELQNARIRLYAVRGTSTTYANNDYYFRFHGASLTVNYTITNTDPYYGYTIPNISADHIINIKGIEYNLSISNTSSIITTSPSTSQTLEKGDNQSIWIYNINSLNIHNITDNGVDIKNSLQLAQSGTYQSSVHPVSLLEYNVNSYENISNAYTDSSSSSYAQINCVYMTQDRTYVTFAFGDIAIPPMSTINSVVCTVKAYTSSSVSGTIELYSGNTLKSTMAMPSTSYDEATMPSATWTVDELNDLKIKLYSDSYGYSNYFRFYGATLTVNHTTPGTGQFAKYTISNVSGDHSISISDLTYNLTITNTSSVITTSPSTSQTMLKGDDQNVYLYGINSLNSFNITDNNVDVKSSLVLITPGSYQPSIYPVNLLEYDGYQAPTDVSNAYTGSDSDTSTKVYIKTSGRTYMTFEFDDINIPSVATINSVSCSVKSMLNLTSAGNGGTIELYSGSIVKSTTTMPSGYYMYDTGTVKTMPSATWTADELNDLKIKLYTDETNSNPVPYNKCILFYGATLTVSYTIPGTDSYYTYVISNVSGHHVISISDITYDVEITNTSTKATTSPATTQTVLHGGSQEIELYLTNGSTLNDISITDNGVDVKNQLVYITPPAQTQTFTPAAFVDGRYQDITNQTNPVGQGSSSTVFAQVNLTRGSGATTYAFWSFDCSSIPVGATITSVTCSAKCYISNVTSTRIVATKQIQLYSGTTAMGSASTIPTSETEVNITCGTWTREELQNARIRLYAVRGSINTTTSYYIYFYGATLTVNYTAGDGHYVYTISNIAADHTILISDATGLYLKSSNAWVKVSKIYKKINNVWTEVTLDSLTEPGVYIKK